MTPTMMGEEREVGRGGKGDEKPLGYRLLNVKLVRSIFFVRCMIAAFV